MAIKKQTERNNDLGVERLFLYQMFLLFLGLKLGNVIDWSWWWVFAPLWIPIVGVLVVMGVLLVIVILTNPKRKQK